MSCTATINETESAAPQMITVKDTMSPTSHLYSEKISIARDAAIFEIKRENYCPTGSPDGARFSSRYEIYNSTTRPFGKCYRELTLTSSSSTTSGGCETGSSSSCCSETTTYVTCNSESEPVQMTGFQHNMEEELEQLCKNNSDGDIRIVVKSDIRTTVPDTEETGEDKELEDKVKPNVKSIKIEAWRSAVADDDEDGGEGQILKSPKILREMIRHYERTSDGVAAANGSAKEPEFGCPPCEEHDLAVDDDNDDDGGKIVSRCRSLLNLERRDKEFEEETNESEGMSKKSVSEVDLNQRTDHERRPPSSRDAAAAKKEYAAAAATQKEEKEKSKKIVNIAIRPDRKCSRIKLEDKFEKKMNDLLLGRKLRAASTSSCSAVNEALANEVVVVESPASKLQSGERGWNCRVTGELRKNTVGVNGGGVLGAGSTFEQRYGDLCTLPRTAKSHRSQLQRHFYYHNGRPRSMLLKDDELPDPDKVKLARELFENVLKLRSRANDITAAKFNTINCWKPRGGNDDASPANGNQRTEDLKRGTEQYRQQQQQQQQQRHQKVRRTVTLETDQPSSGAARTVTTTKWTDDRSLSSSGVGSDVSAETDSDSNPRGADTSSDCSNKDEPAVFSSEDEGQQSGDGANVRCLGQPVSSEILNKIRAFGTSVTYYGGKVIARNEGHTCSPMTMTIMDEIRQHARNDQMKAGTLDGRLFTDRKYFGAKFELRKSISCDSRLERSCGGDDVAGKVGRDVAKNADSENGKSEPIAEEDAKRETADRAKERTSLRAREQVVTGEKIVASSYSEMEFEEFQVLDDIIAETGKK